MLYNNGKLSYFGDNNAIHSGLGGSGTSFKLTVLNYIKPVSDIDCGYKFTMIIDNEGKVWGVGRNLHG